MWTVFINSQSKNVISSMDISLGDALSHSRKRGLRLSSVSGRTQKRPQNHKLNPRSKFICVTLTIIRYQAPAQKHKNTMQALQNSVHARGSPDLLSPSVLQGFTQEWFTMHFNISPGRAGISSMFNGVPLSLSQTYVMKKCVFLTKQWLLWYLCNI